MIRLLLNLCHEWFIFRPQSPHHSQNFPVKCINLFQILKKKGIYSIPDITHLKDSWPGVSMINRPGNLSSCFANWGIKVVQKTGWIFFVLKKKNTWHADIFWKDLRQNLIIFYRTTQPTAAWKALASLLLKESLYNWDERTVPDNWLIWGL